MAAIRCPTPNEGLTLCWHDVVPSEFVRGLSIFGEVQVSVFKLPLQRKRVKEALMKKVWRHCSADTSLGFRKNFFF
jgi:hypothetical protein